MCVWGAPLATRPGVKGGKRGGRGGVRDYFSRRRRILEKSRVAQGLRWARADWRVRTCNASLGHAQPGPAAASPPPARSARGTARPGPARGAAARGGTGMEGMGWDGAGHHGTARHGTASTGRDGGGLPALPLRLGSAGGGCP